MAITTTQLHLTKSKLRFCAGSNPAHGVSEICNAENLWQWCWLEISNSRKYQTNTGNWDYAKIKSILTKTSESILFRKKKPYLNVQRRPGKEVSLPKLFIIGSFCTNVDILYFISHVNNLSLCPKPRVLIYFIRKGPFTQKMREP